MLNKQTSFTQLRYCSGRQKDCFWWITSGGRAHYGQDTAMMTSQHPAP